MTMLAAVLPMIGCGGNESTDPVSHGKAIAKESCKECHDSGDGSYSGSTQTVAVGHSIFAKNISSDVETGIGGWTDAQVINAIKNGIDDEGMMLCSAMPRQAGKLSDEDLSDLVAFLRTLPAVSKEIPDSVCVI